MVRAKVVCSSNLSLCPDGYSHRSLPGLELDMMVDIHWQRVVQLTVAVRYPFELIFLLRKRALPWLEHLDVTIVGGHLEDDVYRRAPETIRFCEQNIRQMVDVSGLRTLVVRQLALEQVAMFVCRLHSPVLHELTLADIFDSSKSFERPSTFSQYSRRFRSIETL